MDENEKADGVPEGVVDDEAMAKNEPDFNKIADKMPGAKSIRQTLPSSLK